MTDLLIDIAERMTGMPVTAIYPEAIGKHYLIKETDTHFIEVGEQIYNWRVCSTPIGETCYDAAYCYLGKDVVSFLKAVQGAAAWEGPDFGDPPGYDKNALTGHWARAHD